MKTKKSLLLAVLMMITLIGGVLTGCGSPSVNLNDYVNISTNGYDGYGEIYVSLDSEQLIEDYSEQLTDKSLDTQYFGSKTPEVAANFVFSSYDPYELAYDADNNLKNGDTISFSWNTNESAIETLKSILKVNIKFSDFTYTVSDLKPLQECDPFEYAEMEYYGISGTASSSYYNKTKIPTGETVIEIDLHVESRNDLANGDSIHVALDLDETPEYYAEHYGLRFTRTEADIIVENVPYAPQENPEEIFQYITDKSFNNINTALDEMYGEYAGEMKYEFVGAVYYYTDPTDNLTDSRLALVYHFDNGIYPGGWYNFFMPGDTAVVRQLVQEDGSILKTTTFAQDYINQDNDSLLTNIGNYCRSFNRFVYDGLYYQGFTSLEECLYNADAAASTFKDNYYNTYTFTHMVATDSLAAYVAEY